ncbi:hypothetical protein OMP38_05975 [Cohnella ginsengisoli]|uniref:Uncharacterized protein n=1 Tax=Cohnella ginsengisoli TaxID=425004 RepID=A0A9X4QL77_9BACL|nr:hypothetical protein [Cohnella ginsengisoli]MDG0790443.1 hypothetical protein [Cohnella ginsengisoli]
MPIKETGLSRVLSIAKDSLWIVIPLIIAAAIFGYKYHFPKRIAADYPAVEYRTGDPSSAEQTNIHVNGKLYRPLFRDPYFKGRIAIDKYEFTGSADYSMFTIMFTSDIQNGWGLLSFSTYLNHMPSIESLGTIWQHGDMKELKVNIFDPVGADKKESKDLMLIAPATTIDEALTLERSFADRGQK